MLTMIQMFNRNRVDFYEEVNPSKKGKENSLARNSEQFL